MTTKPGVKHDLIQQFYDDVSEFLQALLTVWPECTEIRKKKLEFDIMCTHPPSAVRSANRETAIKDYHESMHDHYVTCSKMDDVFFTDERVQSDVSFLQGISFGEKWNCGDIDDETKTRVWEFINAINRSANLYNLYSKVPSKMMGNIEKVATDITENMGKEGDGDGDGVGDGPSMANITKQVMGMIDKDDLDQFARNISEPGAIKQLCSMFSCLGEESHDIQNVVSEVAKIVEGSGGEHRKLEGMLGMLGSVLGGAGGECGGKGKEVSSSTA